MTFTKSTIAALATSSGPGAVAIVRLSGPDSLAILKRVFVHTGKEKLEPRRMYLGKVNSRKAKMIDEILAVWFKAPNSFTGEDCVELQGHAGAAAQLVLEAVLEAGASPAQPGEFSKRAFLNGKIDLSQAEAIAELVGARGRAEASLAAQRLAGGLTGLVAPIRDQLMDSLARLEAAIDFSDDVESVDMQAICENLSLNCLPNLDKILADSRFRHLFRDGLKVTLAGAPNAGKSSLFNALTGQQRALVSGIPGTTRDYLTAEALWEGVYIELCDTAGLSTQASNELDALGQARSKELLAEADIILWVRDAWADKNAYDISSLLPSDRTLMLWNKIDLCPSSYAHPQSSLFPQYFISAKTGEGVEELKKTILKVALGRDDLNAPEMLPNARQQKALEGVREKMEEFFMAVNSGMPPDICAMELRAALNSLEEICGRATSDEVLEEIFSRFCLGK